MARTPTTYDTFSAIAEPRRRAILEALLQKDMTVNELAAQMGWNQPVVSKHLAVLKTVGLVSETKDGRKRIYSPQPEKLQPINEWLKQFVEHWNINFDQLGDYLNSLQAGEKNHD